jgi:S1-C subfamily serine protease
MVVQELSWDIIEAMQQIDVEAQIEMLQTIQKSKPILVVTHIHQGSQADHMEWQVGELIITANSKGVHTLEEFQKVLEKKQNDYILLECRNGKIGYFFNKT